MPSKQQYEVLLALAKAYLASNPSVAKRVEAAEVANTAWINLATGKGGSKIDGDLRYAIMVACDPRRKDNIYSRSECVESSYDAVAMPFEDLVTRDTIDMVEVYDAIDTLPEPQFLALCRNIEGSDCNKQDLEAGQKAMRDIYDS